MHYSQPRITTRHRFSHDQPPSLQPWLPTPRTIASPSASASRRAGHAPAASCRGDRAGGKALWSVPRCPSAPRQLLGGTMKLTGRSKAPNRYRGSEWFEVVQVRQEIECVHHQPVSHFFQGKHSTSFFWGKTSSLFIVKLVEAINQAGEMTGRC